MAVTASMPLVSVGSSTPMIDIARTSGGIDRKTSVRRIRTNSSPAAEIAGDESDGYADRHGDGEHDHAENKRYAIGVDDARKQIAADEVGAQDVRPGRRLVGDWRNRTTAPRSVGKRRDEIGEHGRKHHDADQDQPEQRQRIANRG